MNSGFWILESRFQIPVSDWGFWFLLSRFRVLGLPVGKRLHGLVYIILKASYTGLKNFKAIGIHNIIGIGPNFAKYGFLSLVNCLC